MSEQVNNVKSCLRCGSELELQKGSYPMGSFTWIATPAPTADV